MAIKTPKDSLILLPKDIISKIKGANAEELKTLIYSFAEPESSVSDMAREMGMTVAQAESAVAFWRGAGVFEETEAPKKRLASDVESMYRNYDSASLNQVMQDVDFKMVYNVACNAMGQAVLTKPQQSSLAYLYDFARIPAPVLCGVIELCVSMGKNNMQYIHKTALKLYEKGIDTYDKFEQYLAYREMIKSNVGKIRKLFGMGDRALTPKEEKLFDCWFGEWNFSFDMVKLAFEKTIDSTGKLSTTYMNGILRRWQESGFENPEDVKKGESSRTAGTNSSFAGDEFIEAALNRGFDD